MLGSCVGANGWTDDALGKIGLGWDRWIPALLLLYHLASDSSKLFDYNGNMSRTTSPKSLPKRTEPKRASERANLAATATATAAAAAAAAVAVAVAVAAVAAAARCRQVGRAGIKLVLLVCWSRSAWRFVKLQVSCLTAAFIIIVIIIDSGIPWPIRVHWGM
ncbi:hypothetical protein VM1G_04402 [Cytospora mali]|uniref:Uncharacterized protein n=1 Tax=Cytospora mali TaxID=578113 RepID=A0A194VX40_CYTMA|nr:hypothetical protein VM1G_04402 [Valsa mali]